MTGLDKIVERIAKDSAANCDEIIAQAQKEAATIKEAAEKTVNDNMAAVIEKTSKDCKVILDTAESGSELEGKKEILKAQVEIINETIDAAAKKLADMPENEYFEAIYALVKKYARGTEGEMLLSQKDLGRLPGDFAQKINEGLPAGASIKVSDKAADILQGFILVYGGIEINCTFNALIEDARDDIKDELYKIIFA
ncbi:MAG: hypothetical protein MJ129_05160 [Clostridia bacterium]|nr:hypothetical protein [Clostridia bacterium]